MWVLASEVSAILPSHPGYHTVFGGWAPELVQAAAAVLCAGMAARMSGPSRLAWALIAAGILVWTLGDVYWMKVLEARDQVPVPSPADLGYLLFPILAFAGMLVLLKARVGTVPRTVLVDGIIVALSATTVSVAFVVQPVAEEATGGLLAVATNLAYPITDALLLSVVLAAFALRGWRMDLTWVLLGAATISFFIADSFYLVESANGTYAQPTLYDAGWTASTVLLALAAWAPAEERAAEARMRDTRDIVLPLTLAFVAIIVTLLQPPDAAHAITLALGGSCIAAMMVRLVMTFRENMAMMAASRAEALTDALTGLGNRRALTIDLERHLAAARDDAPAILAMFDLDGFKGYNDAFGHPAGDVLLARLGARLAVSVAGRGSAYRMGGDEFCALIVPGAELAHPIVGAAAFALTEKGEGFEIGSSFGVVTLPCEAIDAEEALRLVDQRMYAAKHGGRASAGRQSKEVLLRAMCERNEPLGSHMAGVSSLAEALARRLGLAAADVAEIRDAAALHDIGKVAIPDAILNKRDPLEESEEAFVREHPIVGERIIAAAPALRGAAKIVRATHERFDGGGYPDRLKGSAIPLGARIIAVCDAFEAMVSSRSYRDAIEPTTALAELRECAGSQFDPLVVQTLCDHWAAISARVAAA
ncbi:MAG TPA: HD domain-containing phosphohydrolase [Solirubrobacteraceae bacterium]